MKWIEELPLWAQEPALGLLLRAEKAEAGLNAALLEIARLRAAIKQCPGICGYSTEIKK